MFSHLNLVFIWAIAGFFFFIFVFSIQLTVKNVIYKFCQWQDFNCGPLLSEATALPTEPQPLPLPSFSQITNTDTTYSSLLSSCCISFYWEKVSKKPIEKWVLITTTSEAVTRSAVATRPARASFWNRFFHFFCGNSPTPFSHPSSVVKIKFSFLKITSRSITQLGSSVTRLGDLLDFGQIFKAFGNN